MKIKLFLQKYSSEIIVLTLGIGFGSFLMFSSFDSGNGTLMISTKSWSDFASHIPLIRSFSLGQNFPPEFPLFPGEHIKYHFLFYFFVGNLEKIGMPLGFALNVPSIIGFTFLTFMIYLLAKQIFKSKAISVISVIFFLFNSSLSFIYFFQKFPLNTNSLNQIISNSDFLSFAPYGDGIITAFWNLNIYTNQRHLALAFGLSLFIIYIVIQPIFSKTKIETKKYIALGILLGFSFYFHLAALLMTSFVLLMIMILFSRIRKEIFILLLVATLISIPQYLFLTAEKGFSPKIVFGYLTYIDFTVSKFINFWIFNLGASILLIILGFIFSNKNQRKIFAAFFIVFIIGNTIQFSIEMAANHKFFNYFIVIGNMFSAFALFTLWRKKNILKPIVVFLFFLMIFGGIIDFFPLYNDKKITVSDYKQNITSSWIVEHTPKDSIFLNTNFLYDPASLAGRKIYMGWPYFAWSQGYDTLARTELIKRMLDVNDKIIACNLLEENNIDYVEIRIQNPPDPNIPPISSIFNENFKSSFTDNSTNTNIYEVKNNCKP